MKISTFKEMMEDYKHGLYNFTKNGVCSECGACCSRYLALNNKEINTIRQYIKKHNIQQNKHAVNVYANPLFDATCPFLDDTKPNHKCTIYPVRPLICREFKCDCWSKIDKNNRIYKHNLRAVDVTELFFGDKG